MADILDEDVVSTAGAAGYLNERVPGAKFTPVVIWRWMTKGALNTAGQRIRLEHAKLGRKLITSRQALCRFSNRLSATHATEALNTEQLVTLPSADAKADLELNGFYR